MNRQEALKILAQGGRGDEAVQVIKRWITRADAKYREIAADTSRTGEYTRWELAVAYNRTDQELTDELITMAEQTTVVDHGDAQKVFGIDGLPGDAATLIISRRDAGDRVASITDGKELREALDRATRNGDEVMARAIAERAFEIGNVKTLNRFTEARPHLADAVERLWASEQNDGIDGLQFAMLISAMRPNELSDLSPGWIRHLASAGPGAA